MTANKAAIRWCAVYTRKSSEEGLEQQFNSLHAQREAAEAYIKSQRHGEADRARCAVVESPLDSNPGLELAV